ncbi:MAG: DNA-directed RNA polymerase subunit omega [Armatimonadetes bacterium]|nr:DNA-directed RNA polymerase subunit omega [Armatimonadota bacterium]
MIYPSADRLEEHVESRYTLVILAAKRAKQLRDGAPKVIETTSTNPLTIALEEIAAGKITYQVPSYDEVPSGLEELEMEAMTEAEGPEKELAEAEEPGVPTDEAARVADLLKVPAAEEESAEVLGEAAPAEPELDITSQQKSPAAPEEPLAEAETEEADSTEEE